MIGREILNYIIESKIGEGGMATVYKARHKSLQNTYRAIKVLHPALAMDPVIRQKFVTEAQTMSDLNHPNIAKVYDYSEQGHELMLILEYIPGCSLDHLLKHVTGPLPEPRLKKMFSAILDGFSYAHARGRIHRDIKPSNIIITPEDEPKIIDFGIVKIVEDGANPGATKTGTRIGTPLFMSPEQILAKEPDRRADIYALGITLFHMVTGRAPYDAGSLSEFEIQQKIVNDPLPPAADYYPSVSRHLQAVIDKATAKKKEDRFQDCAAFKQALLDEDYRPAGGGKAINSFTADRTSIKKGGSVTLSWEVTGVSSCVITGLGTTKLLKGKTRVSPVAATTYTLKAGGEEQSIHISIKKTLNVKLLAGIAGGLLLLTVIVLAGRKSKHTSDDYSPTITKDTTASVVPPPATYQPAETTTVTDTMASPVQTTTTTSDAPTASTSGELTDEERDQVSRVIHDRTSSFNGYLPASRLDEICAAYHYPVDRYFNEYNADYSYVRSANENYYTKSVRQTRWEIDNNRSSVSKNPDGTYEVELYGDYYYYYQYATTKWDPEREYHLVLHNHYKLNSDYKIVEEYEVSRE